MKTRLLCVHDADIGVPPSVPANLQRGYVATARNVVDVPGDATGDAAALLRSCWSTETAGGPYFILLGPIGATSERLTYPRLGDQFVDSTLSRLITYDGAAWRDISGNAV